MKYIILIGHGPSKDKKYNDVGASGFGDNERDMLRGNFLTSLRKYCGLMDHDFTIYPYNAYRDQYIKTLQGRQNILEIHMDGNLNKSFKGGHVIIHQDYAADPSDLRLAQVIKKYFGWRVNLNKGNGINGRDNLQNVNHAKTYGHNYRLVELGHISNPENHETMSTEYDNLAREILEAWTGTKIKQVCPTCGQPIGGK